MRVYKGTRIHYQKSADIMGTYIKEMYGRIMGNQPYVTFEDVSHIPTCKQCYYITAGLYKQHNFNVFNLDNTRSCNICMGYSLRPMGD